MYTHPDHTRRGVGRFILRLCEEAAVREGFTRLELMSTAAGEPLYRAAGFERVERVSHDDGDVTVPLIRMRKASIARSASSA